jgi:hypothetical protein
MDGAVKRRVYNARLSEHVFRQLFVAGERGASCREIVAVVYAHCPHGGALWAENCVRKAIHYLKRKIAPCGATITADRGPGSRYRLEML